MKKKQVPEATASMPGVPFEAQVELLSRLANNQHFSTLRGQMDGDFMETLLLHRFDDKGATKSPSRFVADLRLISDALPVVLGKLAQFERDRCHVALHEAQMALREKEYRMLGEVEPLSKTVPVTLVIFEADATLCFLQSQIVSERGNRSKFLLPYLPQRLAEKGWASENVTNGFFPEFLWKMSAPLLEKLELYGRKKYGVDNRNRFSTATTLPFKEVRLRKQSMWEKGLAFAFFGSKQKDLLRAFSREEQSRLAVWQFDLPAFLLHGQKYGGSYLNFGLHREDEHPHWQKLSAPFCSYGVTHGFGAIASPGGIYQKLSDKSNDKDKHLRILLSRG